MDEIVHKPSEFTRSFFRIIESDEKDFYNKRNKTGFRGVFQRFKFEIEYKTKYKEIYYSNKIFLKSIKKTTKKLRRKDLIQKHILKLFEYYNIVFLNNFLLQYGYLRLNRVFPENQFITKEDKKIRLLKDIQINTSKEAIKVFKQEFGHYSLNPFEFASKRFRNYDDKEIEQLANIMKDINIIRKTRNINEINKRNLTNDKDLFNVYRTLKEELKYTVVYMISIISECIKEDYKEDKKPFYRSINEFYNET